MLKKGPKLVTLNLKEQMLLPLHETPFDFLILFSKSI